MYQLENKWLGQVARFLRTNRGSFVFCKEREGLMERARKTEYDVHSAITFFLVGLGVGSVLTMVFNPKNRVALEGINGWRRAA